VGEPASGLGQVGGQLSGHLGDPGRSGKAGDAQQVHVPRVVLDDERNIEAGQRSCAVDVEEVHRQDRRGLRDQERAPVVVSLGWGGNRRERRILRIVPAPTRWPRRRSSPWIRTTPQRVLSLASLTIRSANSPASGGRPGALGWVHFLVTRQCRCLSSANHRELAAVDA